MLTVDQSGKNHVFSPIFPMKDKTDYLYDYKLNKQAVHDFKKHFGRLCYFRI